MSQKIFIAAALFVANSAIAAEVEKNIHWSRRQTNGHCAVCAQMTKLVRPNGTWTFELPDYPDSRYYAGISCDTIVSEGEICLISHVKPWGENDTQSPIIIIHKLSKKRVYELAMQEAAKIAHEFPVKNETESKTQQDIFNAMLDHDAISQFDGLYVATLMSCDFTDYKQNGYTKDPNIIDCGEKRTPANLSTERQPIARFIFTVATYSNGLRVAAIRNTNLRYVYDEPITLANMLLLQAVEKFAKQRGCSYIAEKCTRLETTDFYSEMGYNKYNPVDVCYLGWSKEL